MERTQSWQKQAEQITDDQQIHNSYKPQKSAEQPPSQPIVEQIEDDLTALRNQKNKSPLVFYGQIGNSFIISFHQKQLCSFLIRFFIFAAFLIGVQTAIQYITRVSQNFKILLVVLTALQIAMFLFIFYLDPGTLFEDEPEQVNQQRLYCQACRVYKRHKTYHCKYCVKCVKGYDHHCGFFGKCIGRRNYILFCFFFAISIFNGVGSMGSIVYTIYKSMA